MMNEVYWLFVRPKKQQSSDKRVVESIIWVTKIRILDAARMEKGARSETLW